MIVQNLDILTYHKCKTVVNALRELGRGEIYALCWILVRMLKCLLTSPNIFEIPCNSQFSSEKFKDPAMISIGFDFNINYWLFCQIYRSILAGPRTRNTIINSTVWAESNSSCLPKYGWKYIFKKNIYYFSDWDIWDLSFQNERRLIFLNFIKNKEKK